MTASVVAAVVQQLHQLHQTALPSGFSCTIGPPVGDIPSRYAAVGYGGDDRAGIVGQGESADVAGFPTESFGVWSTISAATGDNDPTGHLSVVDGLFRPVLAVIRADRTLGGAVPRPGVGELGPYEWTVEPVDTGTVVTVFYQVVVRGVILNGT